MLLSADSLLENEPKSADSIVKAIYRAPGLSPSERAFCNLLSSEISLKLEHPLPDISLITANIDFFDKMHDYDKTARELFILSVALKNNDNAAGSAEALLKAERYAAIAGYPEKTLGLLNDIGLIHIDQYRFDSAFIAFKKYGDIAMKKNRLQDVALANLQMGRSMYYMQKYDSAAKYMNIALKIARAHNYRIYLSSILRYIGYLNYDAGNYSQAKHYLTESLTTSNDKYNTGKYLNLGMVYLMTGQVDSAKICLHKSLINNSILSLRASGYHQLMKIAELEDQIDSLMYYAERYVAVCDTNMCLSLNTSLAGMEKKYNYEKLIAANKSLIIENQRNRILMLFMELIFALGILVYLLLRNRMRKQKLMQQDVLLRQEEEMNILLKKQLELHHVVLQNISSRKELRPRVERESEITPTGSNKKDMEQLYSTLIANVDALYDNISYRLRQKYPDLTQSDILVCSLLLADFSSASIATLFDISLKSFNIRRTRLRKKLGLSHEINLSSFLAQF
jgi:tetratricopeptide (TPR) repeat protein